MSSSIKRVTVTSSVSEAIRQRIISGYYKGGESLRQEAIAAEYEVSRIPVREALLQLEKEGFVVLQPHKGAAVAMLSAEDAQDIFDARYRLEPALARTALEKATTSDFERIERALNEYVVAAKRRSSPDELSKLNWAFHMSLCAPAARPRSMAIVASLHNLADRYLRLQINTPQAKQKAAQDHKQICAAFLARDAEVLVDLLNKHILDAEVDIIVRLGELSGIKVDREKIARPPQLQATK